MTMTYHRPPVPDDEQALSAFHDDRLRFLLALTDDGERGAAATRYITWLDACRVDASAVRDVAVYKLHSEHGLGAHRIGGLFGVNKSRGQQLIYRAAETHQRASAIVATLRRRLGKA
jgi:hypothetical protein